MTVQKLTLGKRKFVVVPEREYQRLKVRAEEIDERDRGDIAESKRRKRTGEDRPYDQLRGELGLA